MAKQIKTAEKAALQHRSRVVIAAIGAGLVGTYGPRWKTPESTQVFKGNARNVISAVGAGLGADLSSFFQAVPMSGIVLLGMVGYFTGVVQTPITAFIIVMEMNDTPSMILPLMATALLAKGVSYLVCPTPIYQALADAYLNKTEQIVEEKTLHQETK